MKKLTERKLLYAIILILIIIVSFGTCSKTGDVFKCNKTVTKNDTVTTVKTDTVWLKQDTVFIASYKPEKVTSVKPKVKQVASKNYDSLLVQFNNISDSFYSKNVVKDKINLKDSLGRDVGVVNIEDSVSENEITSRKINYQLDFPMVTTTITNTITLGAKSKRQLYIGGEITGNRNTWVNGGKAGLLYKDRKDRIYTANVGLISIFNTVQPQYSVGRYWKIGK